MANKWSDFRKTVEGFLNDESKPWGLGFAFLEHKTQCKRFYIFLGLAAFLAVYLVFGYAAQLVCNTLATLYPAYSSLKAIESHQKEDDTKWLTYWTVYALFTLIDYPCDMILSILPFYWLAKCIFMVWLFAPGSYNGSLILYNRIIRPHFLENESIIDANLLKMGKFTEKVGNKLKETVSAKQE